MKTPEQWSKEIYDVCYSPIEGRATVKPEFVKQIQDDAITSAIERMLSVPPAELIGCYNAADNDLDWIEAIRARLIAAAKGGEG